MRNRSKYNKNRKCIKKFKYSKYIILFLNIIILLLINIFLKTNFSQQIIMKDYIPVNVGKLYDFPTIKNHPIIKKEKKRIIKIYFYLRKKEYY